MIFCRWIIPTFIVGYKRDLEISDLFNPLKDHKSSLLGDKISKIWNQELEKLEKKESKRRENAGNRSEENFSTKPVEPSLTKIIVKCFGGKMLQYALGLGITEMCFR